MNKRELAVKEFIESNIELIDENNFSKLYIMAGYDPYSIRGTMTEMLLSAGIDPLDYMNYIPKQYLWNTKTEYFKIPPTIEQIEDEALGLTNLSQITIPSNVSKVGINAFGGCHNLKEIMIEEGVKRIEDYCFSGCMGIEKVYLPKSIRYLGRDIFQHNEPIINIYYNGKEEDWILVIRDRDVFLKSKVIIYGLDFEQQFGC